MSSSAVTLRRNSLRIAGAVAVLVSLCAAAAPDSSKSSAARRVEVLRRAKVWHEPAVPIEQARTDRSAAGVGGFGPDAVVTCRFEPRVPSGGTPKFDCRLANGDVVKVKYGLDNAEVFAEVIATRLLTALGFWADRMYMVGAVRCVGCPPRPFEALKCMHDKDDVAKCFGTAPNHHVEIFERAVIERPLEGRRIEVGEDRGWRWDELNGISRAVGGATPAEIDAFRLLAVFLGHWDSKAENQRLLCVGEPVTGDGCRRPVAMIQDLGASFGPKKLNVGHWEAAPIWDDAATCRVSLRHLPDGVQTFPDIRISEAGRRFLGSRLARLTPRQVRSLFGGAHIEQFAAPDAESRSADRWAAAFATKVRAITERSSCP